MNDIERRKLIKDFCNLDPFSMLAFSKMLYQISSYSDKGWFSHSDIADMFFFVYQDAIKASSEKSLNLLLCPTYFRIIYRDYLFDKNSRIEVKDSHISALCETLPSLVDLYFIVYCSGQRKDEADKLLDSSLASFDEEYGAYLRAIFEILIACGCMAKIYFVSHQVSRIEPSSEFAVSISEVNNSPKSFHDALSDLFVDYNFCYYDFLKIDDRFLFDCAITMYLNRQVTSRSIESSIKLGASCRDSIKNFAISLIKTKPTEPDFEHALIDFCGSQFRDDPRNFIDALCYSRIMVEKYIRIRKAGGIK